jgi:RNA polymerase sigma factor (TIGR02999 family)
VYLKLVRAGGIACENRVHFLALCAQIMRRIVVDHARERASVKRGGGVGKVPIEDDLLAPAGHGVGLIDLDGALEALARLDPRKGRLVELRYFGGLTIDEAAEVLQVSPGTAKRDWLLAKAWLLAELSGKA